MADPRNYVNGDISAPQRMVLRVRWENPGPLVEVARDQTFNGAHIDLYMRRGATWVEYEATSGFYCRVGMNREQWKSMTRKRKLK